MDSFLLHIKSDKNFKDVVHEEVIPERLPVWADARFQLDDKTRDALDRLGIQRLYSHQAEGIALLRQGADVVIMTPAASGKSLVYNIPVIESLLKNPESKALYLFPLKGLEQDQLSAFASLAKAAGLAKEPVAGKRKSYSPGMCEIYDGDTSAYKRQKIRLATPSVLLTNPDMLHLGILPFHQKWEGFFRNLNYVVIDELHTYRGVFGSHVAHVLRRLRRIARLYGSDPVFITCSATIANPTGLAQALTGKTFELVSKNGAPQGERRFIFINPAQGASPYTAATRLFIASIRAGFKTIAFTKARKITELMHSWAIKSAPELAETISSYRAGFLPAERREIESRLKSGALSGVISTSALELGVDIGGLDVCILVGYPGTIASTWQRAGRAGRSGRASLIALVAMSDALDQYFMRNPADFFSRRSEAAVIDAENQVIAKAHLSCAVAEAYLKTDDTVYDAPKYAPLLSALEKEGRVRYWAKGGIWYPRRRYPHREVSIRGIGERFSIRLENGDLLGEASYGRVFYELHPGAIYLHKGAPYLVKRLDLYNRTIVCCPAIDVDFYTSAITHETSEILSVDAEKNLEGVTVHIGALKITETITGYRKKEIGTGELIGEYALEGFPPSVFTTKGIWMKVDEAVLSEVRAKGFSVAGSLHGLEHSAIATLPLFALCDRMDLGGVSYAFNPELEAPAIFIYDGHEGGVGLVQRGFECCRDWFSATLDLMSECKCEVSCPSCTQDPKCGNNNDPLDKRGAILILKSWLGEADG